MIRDRSIIGIFQQNWYFLNFLVVWGTIVQAFAVRGATCKMIGSFGG
jgi:hypothetical protein